MLIGKNKWIEFLLKRKMSHLATMALLDDYFLKIRMEFIIELGDKGRE